MPYPDGMNLAAPGGPEAPPLTDREQRAIDLEEAVRRCERAMTRSQERLSRLEDSEAEDAPALIDRLTLGLELGVAASGGDIAA